MTWPHRNLPREAGQPYASMMRPWVSNRPRRAHPLPIRLASLTVNTSHVNPWAQGHSPSIPVSLPAPSLISFSRVGTTRPDISGLMWIRSKTRAEGCRYAAHSKAAHSPPFPPLGGCPPFRLMRSRFASNRVLALRAACRTTSVLSTLTAPSRRALGGHGRNGGAFLPFNKQKEEPKRQSLKAGG